MNPAYDPVTYQLEAKGIRAEFQRPHQLVLSGRLWITWNAGWYVSTWTPAVYPVPPDIDVVAVCEACLNWPGEDPFYVIPEPICERFGLVRMESSEFDCVCLIPPDGESEE
jgi:hypothetical protein